MTVPKRFSRRPARDRRGPDTGTPALVETLATIGGNASRSGVSRRARRTDRRLLLALVSAVTTGTCALVLVAGAAGLHLYDTRPDPHPAPAGRDFTLPTAAPEPTVPVTVASPADRVVAAVLATDPASLFGPEARASAVTTAVSGTPFARACGTGLPPSAVPVAAGGRAARDGDASVRVAVWAYPAGLAGQAVTALADQVRSCRSRDGVAPHVVGRAGVGAETFLATSPGAGDGVAWAVWNTGDVVAHVTVARVGHGPDTQTVRRVAASVDMALRAALAGLCPVLDVTSATGGRNPYTSGRYTGYARTVPVTVPTVPDIAGALVDALPTPAPRATFTPPDRSVRPDLAPPTQPAGWLPGDPPVSAADAPKGPAPTLADPDAFTVPTPAVTDRPVEPQRPTPESPTRTVQVPEPDRDGPGCGWSFTSMDVPTFDEAALTRAKTQRVQDAFAQLTAAASSHRVASLAWVAAYTDWQQQRQDWLVYRQYAEDRQDAADELAAAQRRYDDAVAALNPAPDSDDDGPGTEPTIEPTWDGPTLPDPDGTTGPTAPGPTTTTGPVLPDPAPTTVPTTGPSTEPTIRPTTGPTTGPTTAPGQQEQP